VSENAAAMTSDSEAVGAAIDWADLWAARARGLTPVERLAQLRACPPREAARALAAAFGISAWEMADMARRAPAFDRLPLARAQSLRAALMHDGGAQDSPSQSMVAVVHDPLDADLWTQLCHLAKAPLRFVLASPDDIHAYLNQQEAQSRAVDTLSTTTTDAVDTNDESIEELSLASVSDAASPAIKLVSSTLYDALRAGASDVHLESTPSGLAVKYRVDGVLDAVTEVPGVGLAEQTISRLKVLADLDIAERRIPQDGSFRVRAQRREIDLRVSIIPGIHGEDAVIRILDKQAMVAAHGALRLDSLGFDDASIATLRELMGSAYGMLLVTGPTGSGKTTTLYAALSETHTGRDKIITIEDPVEYQLPGVLQIPVNEKKGLTFARGLRSILRHDPDTIMVGEIRDRETAEIAVQSALTGHLVLTTVHANNVFDVFGRFTHMGLDPYALVAALNGIWAQRLLRLNCPHCSEPYAPSLQELTLVGLSADELKGFDLRRGMGCGDCRGTGYKGRWAVAEILRLDDELRELIVAKQPVRVIKEVAYCKGTRSLTQAALDLARAGRTTLVEVRRVTVAA
jgi:general secretion pathway protein E